MRAATMPIEEEVFRLQEVNGSARIVFTSGKHRLATPEEIRMWSMIEAVAPKEQDAMTRPSLLGWFIFYRTVHATMGDMDPNWFTKIIREFSKLPTNEVLQILKEEFKEDFNWKVIPDEWRAMKKARASKDVKFRAPSKLPWKKRKRRPQMGMISAGGNC